MLKYCRIVKVPSTIDEYTDFIIRAFTTKKIVAATLMFAGIAGVLLSYRSGCYSHQQLKLNLIINRSIARHT